MLECSASTRRTEGDRTVADGTRIEHVVFIADIPTTGGATDCLVELVACLIADHGIRCTVCTAQVSDLNERLAKVGAESVVTGHDAFLTTISKVNWKKPVSFAKRWLVWKSKNLRALKAAEDAIDFDDVDIVHSNLPRNDIGMVLARRHGLPHICHLRENSFEGFKLISLKPSPEKYLASGTDAFVAVSRSVRDNWARRGMDKSKIRVIYDGISTDDIARYSQGQNLRRDDGRSKLRCVFLGGYYGVKGLPCLLEAVAGLDECARARVCVSVYGSGRDSGDGLAEQFVRSHNLEGVVELNGYAEDVPSLLAHYDVGLACSRHEAFGRIILEYRAAGLAVVASRAGSFPELVNDGVDGFLYDPEGSAALTGVLSRLVGNPGEAARVAGAPHPIRTEEDIAEEIVGLYSDVVSRRLQTKAR